MPAKKRTTAPEPSSAIRILGARQHNLKDLNLDIPIGQLTVLTGPSGCGKSSLAFHTLYAEGQRRYVETFSPYVRQFFDRMDKPDVDRIEGIPPAIAIEQKNTIRTSRSTVGTLTEINDYLKLLFARAARGYDPNTGEEIRPDSPESATEWALENLSGEAILVTFPVPIPPDTATDELFPFLNQQGYLRILTDDGRVLRTDEHEAPASGMTVPVMNQSGTISVIQDRITLTKRTKGRLLEALEHAFTLGKGESSIVSNFGVQGSSLEARRFSTKWQNPATGHTLRAPTSALFSFNNPLGACPTCRGFGRTIGLDLEKSVPDPSLSIKKGAIRPFQGDRGDECQRDLLRNCRERDIDVNTPWFELDEDVREWIYYGDPRSTGVSPVSGTPTSELEALEEIWQSGGWYGIKGFFDWLETKSYKMHVRVFLSRYRSYTACPTCRGKRLQPEALCFKIGNRTLPDLWQFAVDDLVSWFGNLQSSILPPQTTDPSLKLILTEISSRLGYLDEVGLGYLTLDRPARTLSGGEIERVNLTACLGASLANTLFVLDEPTVGLHSRDIQRLVGIMHRLRDRGNTLVVVEHEETVMRSADHLVDLGPGSGENGGTILYSGCPGSGQAVKSAARQPSKSRGAAAHTSPQSQGIGTMPWLHGKRSIPVPTKRRKAKDN